MFETSTATLTKYLYTHNNNDFKELIKGSVLLKKCLKKTGLCELTQISGDKKFWKLKKIPTPKP